MTDPTQSAALRELASLLAPSSNPNRLRLAKGHIQAIDGNTPTKTVSLYIDGDTTALVQGVPFLSAYATPAVGDVVVVAIQGSDILVLDKVSGATVPGGWVKVGTYTPSGVNFLDIPIPSGFSDLEIRWVANSSGAANWNNLSAQLNGDQAANYSSWQKLNNSGADNNGASTATSLPVGFVWAHSTTTKPGAGVISINGYSGSTLQKLVYGTAFTNDGSSTTAALGLAGGEWLNTAAITSIRLILANSATFNTGSRFNVYAIA